MAIFPHEHRRHEPPADIQPGTKLKCPGCGKDIKIRAKKPVTWLSVEAWCNGCGGIGREA